MATSVVDLFLVYSLLKRLVLPFKYWDAFKAGVIDKDGGILIPPDKRTRDQSRTFKEFDVMVRNMKLLLGKIPGGKSLFASFGAALYLLKEDSSDLSEQSLLVYLSEHVDNELYQEFIQTYPAEALQEDAPTNNVGAGNIAGMHGDGPAEAPIAKMLRRHKLTTQSPKYLRMRKKNLSPTKY